MSVAIHLKLAVTKYAPPLYRLSTTLTLSACSRKTALREQHTQGEGEIERQAQLLEWRVATEAAQARHKRRTNNLWRVLLLKVGTSGWKSCHRCTPAFCFVPHRKWFQTSGLIALSNGSSSRSAQFSPIQLSNGAWVQVRVLQFLNRTEDFHDLEVNWKEAQSSQVQFPNYNSMNCAHGCVSLALRCMNACLGPPACACKFRLHACARRNIVGVQRHALSFTGNFENRARAFWSAKAPCWHFEYSKSNELFERTWC